MKTSPDDENRTMTVAGIMSGTSADGIDVALVRIRAPRNSQLRLPQLRLLAHVAVPYPAAVRKCILQMMNADAASVADMSRLHWRLGQLYADAVKLTLKEHPMRLDLVGCHGQTIYHQGIARPFLGAPVACTWQMGEASVIAAELDVPVVSDFRPADLALGGQGAPLVPLLDYVAFHHPTRNRVLQNLGGIANLTVIPAGASQQEIFAFDSGPANMVIDALMGACFGKKYDAQGATARRGCVLESVVEHYLRGRFFQAPPPKSAGREQFGREFVARFLADCRKQSKQPEDAVATATVLTARSIGRAWKDFVAPALSDVPTDYIVAGGGARNCTLMEMLGRELEALGKINSKTSDEFGMPAAAKEAMAFALLAYQTWHRQSGNLPRATGATRPAILGKITHA
ncbi:MAG TPA: anhydro-N-acetylmuramic acid kinase [Acidobacteriaceae bacterium]|nr:anhydro-N-acetylmuramic acid kinase [Acidobacteriaceae bacterium]